MVENAQELLGLFVGPPLEEWDRTDGAPETVVIYLFRRNLEDDCLIRAELEEFMRYKANDLGIASYELAPLGLTDVYYKLLA